MGADCTQGNAWQYIWLIPHDVPGLIDLFCVEELFVSKLYSLYTAESDMVEKGISLHYRIGRAIRSW